MRHGIKLLALFPQQYCQQYSQPMTRFSKGSRDTNEPAITEVLRRRHVPYAQLHEGDGADLLIMIAPMELWEVKNGSRSPSKRRLTEAERKAQEYCEDVGIPYVVIETPEDASERLDRYFARTSVRVRDARSKV
jgi:hypothetical protein